MPATGTSTNGAAAPSAAATASATRRHPSPRGGPRCARAIAISASATQAATIATGSERERWRGSGHSGRASTAPDVAGARLRPEPDSALATAGATLPQSSASMKNRTRRPFSVRNQPTASARRTTRCRAASPSLSLSPRASILRALVVPPALTLMSSRPAGPNTPRTPGTSRSRCSASDSACRLAAANTLSTSTVTSCSVRSPNRLAAWRPRSTATGPGGAHANGSCAARASRAAGSAPSTLIEATRARRPVVTPTKVASTASVAPLREREVLSG